MIFVKRETGYILKQKLCFNIPCPMTNTIEKSIAYVRAKLWNKIDNKVGNIGSLDAFKKRTIRKMSRDFTVLKYGSSR